MVNPANLSAQLPVGGADLSALRRSAKENSPEAIKAVAQQFEALMMNMMMKSMREATPKGGLFDSEQTRLYMSLLDQQLSQSFAKRGIGLADALVKQMTAVNGKTTSQDTSTQGVSNAQFKQSLTEMIRQQQSNAISTLFGNDSTDSRGNGIDKLFSNNMTSSSAALNEKYRQRLADLIAEKQSLLTESAPSGSSGNATSTGSGLSLVHAFQKRLTSIAERVSQQTGIPAKFMLAQAALETGWGKSVMTCENGSSSHNLFGIKATSSWKGKVAESVTTEYVNGVAYKTTEKFRAYDSYEESFRDYANFLQSNPRYKQVLSSGDDASRFAQSLQAAGYATDPRYAEKLTKIIQTRLST